MYVTLVHTPIDYVFYNFSSSSGTPGGSRVLELFVVVVNVTLAHIPIDNVFYNVIGAHQGHQEVVKYLSIL